MKRSDERTNRWDAHSSTGHTTHKTCKNVAMQLQLYKPVGLVLFWNLVISLFYSALMHNETKASKKEKQKWFIENTHSVVVT